MGALEDQQPSCERPWRWGEGVALGGDETAQFGNAYRQPDVASWSVCRLLDLSGWAW
jgi:hypothetical protein